MYKYEKAIEILTEKIPAMKDEYLLDKDYYEDIPYVFYESVFEKYIVAQIEENNVGLLKHIFCTIEDLLQNGDDEIKTLVDVAVVESLFFEENSKKLIELTQTYFGKLTKLSFEGFS